MTSVSDHGEGVFKPPDDTTLTDFMACHDGASSSGSLVTSSTLSPREVGTPDPTAQPFFEHTLQPGHSLSNSSTSVATSAHSKRGSTPRAELSHPVYPLGAVAKTDAPVQLNSGADHMNVDGAQPAVSLRPEAGDPPPRRKFAR